MNKFRSFLYKTARYTGDIKAISSGSPKRMAKRGANKLIGRHIVRRLWIR